MSNFRKKINNLLYKSRLERYSSLLKEKYNASVLISREDDYYVLAHCCETLMENIFELIRIYPDLKPLICTMNVSVSFELNYETSEGLYSFSENKIVISENVDNAVSHELFHAIDYQLAKAMGIEGGMPLTDWLEQKENKAVVPFVKDTIFGHENSEMKDAWEAFEDKMKVCDKTRNELCPRLPPAYLSRPSEMYARVFEKNISLNTKNESLKIENEEFNIMSYNRNILLGGFSRFPSDTATQKMATRTTKIISYAKAAIVERNPNCRIAKIVEQGTERRKQIEQKKEKIRSQIAKIQIYEEKQRSSEKEAPKSEIQYNKEHTKELGNSELEL